MKYVYLLILCIIIALIISFRSYKQESYASLSKKDAPLKALYGFSMVLISLAGKFVKVNQSEASKEKLYAKLKSISIGICAFTIIIFFGLLYSFTSKAPASTENNNQESTLEIADIDVKDDDTTTESTSSPTLENEKYNKIKETISIFENYREDIESTFLNENENYMSVTKPLNLVTEFGEENIAISWAFEPDNVVDSSGNILYENISDNGCSTLVYATLTLDDVTATLTIPIFICPP